MPLLPTLRTRATKGLELAFDLAASTISISGSALAAFLGKFLLAAVLAGLAAGFVLRLKRRRSPGQQQFQSTPGWATPLAACISFAEATLLVEAIDLPVRFHQSGFRYEHWALVGAFLLAAFALQRRLFARLGKVPRESAP